MRKALLLTAVVLLVVLGFLFREGLVAGQAIFSNDSPLGLLKSSALQLPEGFFGYWLDLNWIGSQGPSAVPGYSFFWFWLTGAVGFAKTYALASTLIMGLCAAFCFARMGLNPAVCVLGGLAAALNMNSLSNAAWGLGSRSFVFAVSFLAIAALYSYRRKPHWAKIPLAGLAVGLGIVDGYDVGAIFSLYVAAFGLFMALTEEGSPVKNFVRGAVRVAVVAIFAAFISAAALITLVETQVKGVATQADNTPAEAKWQFATQWSLPKIETLRILIPGLYGYGMPGMYGIPYDEYGRLTYWGNVGAPDGHPMDRLSGAGEYAGMLVLLIAAFALAQAARGEKGAFDLFERRCVWFWAGSAVVSLLFAFGHYAPFYQLIYHLPFFHNVRNPIKFTHPLQLSLLMLFAYGLQVVYRKYLAGPTPRFSGIREQVGAWWKTAPAFETKWTVTSALVTAAMLMGWLVYNSSRSSLVAYLKSVMQPGYPENILEQMARYSIADVGLSALLLALAVALLTVILSGALSGRRAKWAGVLMGVFIALDLGHANAPWIIHFNYLNKYATNPVIDVFRDRPYERRVMFLPFDLGQGFSQFHQEYFLHWLQNLFPYYNIQSLDVAQDPRPGSDKGAFVGAFSGGPNSAHSLVRYWELTNTRLLIGVAGPFADRLNDQLDPARKSFRSILPFEWTPPTPAGPATVVESSKGPFSVIEFTNALPRVSLYSRWDVMTNDDATLKRLTDPAWDPHQTVMVATNLSVPAASAGTNGGTVTFTSYTPKHIELSAKAVAPSVMLLNDRYAPDWHAWVDGKPTDIFRCNYIMQGLYLTPGDHKIELRFEPKSNGLYVSIAAYGIGLLLCGLVVMGSKGEPSATQPQPVDPKPVEPKEAANAAEPKAANKPGKDKKRG
jgi:hypothetical protein